MTEDLNSKLGFLRGEIEKIDTKILELMSDRLQIASEIGNIKKKLGILEAKDEKRWNYLMEKNIYYGTKKGLKNDFIIKIWNIIHKESLDLQK
ncbi:MAG TPA: chorismate mutase [Candidatus Absconditabacterales bacterium]|nr:chorismate mutase [Candidatus Absconditabacterales bacterium]